MTMSGHCPTFCCGLAFFFSFLKRGRNPATHKYLPLFLPYQEKHRSSKSSSHTHTKKNPSQYSRHIHTSITSTLPKHHLITTTTHTLSHPLSLSLSHTHTHKAFLSPLFFVRPTPFSLSSHPPPTTLSLSSHTHIYTYIHIHYKQHTFFRLRGVFTLRVCI